MVNVDLIIFDIDGTLVDSKSGIVESINFTLKQLGLKEKPFDEIISFIGWGVEYLVRRSLGEENRTLFEKGLLMFEDYYKKNSVLLSRLYPHVEDILDYFKNKSMFVLTNRKTEMALVTLRGFGIEKYFKQIIGGDEKTCLKPSACSLEKVPILDKDKSIIVGDMDVDILTGKNSGILTCAVTYGIGKKDEILKAEPDFVIDDMADLKKIIK